MGIIFSRHKKSTLERLEELENTLGDLEAYRKDTELRQKYIVGYILLISAAAYLLAVLFGYFYYYPATWQEALTRLLPLFLFPGLIWLFRSCIVWLFAMKIDGNDRKAAELRRDRKTILDNVKDKETYKVAKEILERFDPQAKMEKNLRERQEKETVERAEMARRMSVAQTQGNLRQRIAPTRSNPTPFVTPVVRAPMLMVNGKTAIQPTPSLQSGMRQLPMGFPPGSAPPARLARPILPAERGKVDKLLDYLLKDGPSNRYALICRDCHFHNGMALQEEFDFLAFRCCYCNAFNPARKQKPNAPQMPTPTVGRHTDVSSMTSQSVTGTSTAVRRALELTQSGTGQAVTTGNAMTHEADTDDGHDVTMASEHIDTISLGSREEQENIANESVEELGSNSEDERPRGADPAEMLLGS